MRTPPSTVPDRPDTAPPHRYPARKLDARQDATPRSGRIAYRSAALPDAADAELLQWLLHYPFQRVDDLAVALRCVPASALRRVTRQQALGLVEALTPAALGHSPCHLYSLSARGLHAIAERLHADPAALARACGSEERALLRLLPRLPTLVRTQDVVTRIVVGAGSALGDAARPLIVRWHWLRDWHERVPVGRTTMGAAADAALVLHVRPTDESTTASAVSGRPSLAERWYALLVLVDAAVAPADWIARRLSALIHYRESPQRWPVYGSFPTVLVLVDTPHRADMWHAQAAAQAAQVGAPLVGGIAVWPTNIQEGHISIRRDPWTIIWQRLGEGRVGYLVPGSARGSTGTMSRLTGLLAPLPAGALPAALRVVGTYPQLSGPDGSDAGHSPAPGQTGVEEAALQRKPSSRPPRALRGGYAARGGAAWHAVSVSHGTANAPGLPHTDWQSVLTALLAPQLTRQQWRLLDLLFAHPLLSVDDLSTLLDVLPSSIERYLRPLVHAACVAEVPAPPASRYHLAERGLRLVASANQLPPRSLLVRTDEGDRQRGLGALQRNLEHTAGVYGFFVQLLEAARERSKPGEPHVLAWWETGSACERRYYDGRRWHNLRPDGAAEYHAGHRRVRFWLEWDRGTMNRRDLIEKLRTYADFMLSTEATSLLGMKAAPTLLVVVPDPAQEARVALAAQKVLGSVPPLNISATTSSRLSTAGPLGAVWRRCAPREGVPPQGPNQSEPYRTFVEA